ncbi:unnamed protein product [Dicrocoelium dendriticum]|nr:unnamed protein product [Dicrocoelium dendriticum]
MGAPTSDRIAVMLTGFAYENGKQILWDEAYEEGENLKSTLLYYSIFRTSLKALEQNSAIREALYNFRPHEPQKGSALIKIELVFNKTELERHKISYKSAEFLRTIFDLFKSYATWGEVGDQSYFGTITEITSEVDNNTYSFYPNEVFTRSEERTHYFQSLCSGSSANRLARHIFIFLLMKYTRTLL